MKNRLTLLFTVLLTTISIIAFANIVSANPPTDTVRNERGFVIAPYPAECATKECFDCGDFEYQEDAQAFFNAFANDPSGLDGPRGAATAGKPNVACEARPHRPVR